MALGLSDSDLGISSGGVITIAQFVAVAWDGLTIPPDSLFMHENGQHNGLANAAALTDTGAFAGKDYTGFIVRNTSKATATVIETATITSNTDDVVSGALTNSADWDIGNYYEIIVAGLETGDKIWHLQTSDAGGAVSITVKGVPSITGASGTHVITYYLEDITDNSLSAIYTLTVTVA
jgi:hypothetical protein